MFFTSIDIPTHSVKTFARDSPRFFKLTRMILIAFPCYAHGKFNFHLSDFI